MAALKKPAEQNFYAGERVPDAGIYFVMHGDHHRAPHELTLLAKAKFPVCSVCGDDVQFRLLHSAPYLFEDDDFNK